MTVTNNATLTWQWTTNYWRSIVVGPHGSVNVGNGWQPIGSSTQITAVADQYYHLSGWGGDASGGANPLMILMDRPKAVVANFAETLTTAHPTPHLWLAQYYGSTAAFEQVSLADTDGDGHFAWQEYMSGSVPTNRESVFSSMITVSNGVARIRWTPDLGPERVYTVEGRSNLTTGVWGTTNSSSRFFRVKVQMP
jgi:hypothetical protein